MTVLLERQKLIERSVYEDEKHTKQSIAQRQLMHKGILSLFGKGKIPMEKFREVSVPGANYKSRFAVMDYLVAMRTRFQELRLQLSLDASDLILSENKVTII